MKEKAEKAKEKAKEKAEEIRLENIAKATGVKKANVKKASELIRAAALLVPLRKEDSVE